MHSDAAFFLFYNSSRSNMTNIPSVIDWPERLVPPVRKTNGIW